MTGPGNPESMRHTKYLDQYLRHVATRCAANTVRLYTSALRRAHAEMPYGVVLASDVEIRDWVHRTDRAASTRESYRNAIAGLHRWLILNEITTMDPMPFVPHAKVPQRLPRPITDDELRQILAEALQPVRLWATIAAYAGARCVEVARLQRRDVTATSIRLYGKGDRERAVPTHAAVWAAVEPLPAGPIVSGAARNPRELSGRAAREFDRIGLPEVTMHRLRHWCASTALDATDNLRAVQELLGHSRPDTTAVYAALSTRALRAAVNSLPSLDAGSPAAARAAEARRPS